MNIDTTSMTWRTVKQWAEQELQRVREDLEFEEISELRAQLCRGEIKRLKALLDLPRQTG